MTDNSPEKRRTRWQEYLRMQIADCDKKIAAGQEVEEQTARRQEWVISLESMPASAITP